MFKANMTPFQRLENAFTLAEFYAQKAKVQDFERYADTLANVRGMVRRGFNHLSPQSAEHFALTLEHAADVWKKRGVLEQDKCKHGVVFHDCRDCDDDERAELPGNKF